MECAQSEHVLTISYKTATQQCWWEGHMYYVVDVVSYIVSLLYVDRVATLCAVWRTDCANACGSDQ